MVIRTKKTKPNIQFLRDGIHFAEKRVADPILVTAFATSDTGTARERAFTVVKFMNRRRKWKREIVPSSMLTVQMAVFVTLLSSRGYVWPPNQSVRAQIIGALSIVIPKRNIRVTDVPGHLGQSFVLPGESYGPKGPERKRLQINYNPTVSLGDFRRSGTLDEWKRHVAEKIIHSSRGPLAVGAVFAAPNLRPLNLDTFGFNFYGETSGGKTLLLRWALSAAGLNSSKGPATWDGSPAALEQRALGHRDCVVPLDDLSHLQGDPSKMAKVVTFRLAGNKPKAKAGQYVAAHGLVDTDWRVVPLSTSEDPLWQPSNLRGSRRVRGEEVRLIDVPACISDVEDIFDGENARDQVGTTTDERAHFVEEQERLTLKYQGEAYRAYLARRMADKSAKATLKAYMADFRQNAPLPQQASWLARIRRGFELAYAADAQAIDYRILPWRKKETLAAIRSCMNDAMKQLIEKVSNPATTMSDESLLDKFKNLIDDAVFVRIDQNTRQQASFVARLKKADGVIRPTNSGKVQYLLFSRAFEREFPEVSMRKRLTKLLRSRRIFGKGRRDDTNTRQTLIAELGRKVTYYALSRRRLRASGLTLTFPSLV